MKYFFAIISLLLFSKADSQNVRKNLPNIIYIYADDLGYGEIGVYGQTKIATPNLDKMAKEGMVFTNHYSGSPVCAPARCILLTGKHAGHAYIRGNYELGGFADSLEGGQMPLPEGTYTLPVMLKTAGYTTAAIGKWGLGMNNNSGDPNRQGFDYFYGILDQKQAHNYYPTHLWENGKWDSLQNRPISVHRPLDPATATDNDFNYFKGNEYAPKKMLEKALAFIDSNHGRPFFLYFPSPLPHVSLQVPDEYVNFYKGKFEEQPYYGTHGYASIKYPYSAHAAMITYLDEQVGKIVEKVKTLGLDSNTVIFFSSDNGGSSEGGVSNTFFQINGDLRGQKRDLYEGGIKTPLIVRWPGHISAGSKSNLLSAQYDLMPTLAELTGTDPKHTDGISFLPTLFADTQRQERHPFLYFEFGEKGGSVAVRTGNWKGIKNDLKKNKNAQWELYDLSKDRSEEKNVASLHPDIILYMNEIVETQHWNAHIREWEFINPKWQ